MSNQPVTNEDVTDELQEDPYEIPIRYIEEDDWEDLPDE